MSKVVRGGKENNTDTVFSVVPRDRARGNGHQTRCCKFHLNSGKYFFTVREVKCQNRFPREVDSFPFTNILRIHLEMVLSSLLRKAGLVRSSGTLSFSNKCVIKSFWNVLQYF